MIVFFFFLISQAVVPCPSALALDHHLVGWANALVPGSGQTLLGHPIRGSLEAVLEVSTFTTGYLMSRRDPMSIDGVPEQVPTYGRFSRRVGSEQQNLIKPLAADLLQELGIKSHFVNTFSAYRDAAIFQYGSVPDDMESKSVTELFLEPFQMSNMLDPWVYVPFGVVILATIADFINLSQPGVIPHNQFLEPSSNALYSFNYGIWQPMGSGGPEEMFYRGFLQREFFHMVPSPYFAIPLTSVLFALSHGPGSGRYTAFISGAYLGYLAYRNHGKLGKGITLHFWSVVVLGIETILLNQTAQHSTPPATLSVQINY